jgi:hypothetical protein
MRTLTYTCNEPVPFDGTPEEADKNFATHSFSGDFDGDYRCGFCDCKPWHKAAHYPCGVQPKRQVRNQYSDGTEEILPAEDE